MAYKGTFTPINPSKYKGDERNIVYRSLWERHCFKWLDTNPSVVSWSSEETVVPYYFPIDKSWHRYFVDLKYTTTTGETFLIEVKPHKETEKPKKVSKTPQYVRESVTYIKNQCKWEAATKFADDNGWVFAVWTEHTLYDLGIMPKPQRALKPLKKLKPFRKRGSADR